MQRAADIPILWKLLLISVLGYGIVYALSYAYLIVAGDRVLTPDLRVFWQASDLLLQGRVLDIYPLGSEVLAGLLGDGSSAASPMQPMPYPPTYLLMIAPLALMPYALAAAVWTALGLGLFTLVMRNPAVQQAYFGQWLPAPAQRLLLWCSLLSCYTVLCVVVGQNALFTASLILLGLAWRTHRPVLSGVCLGLLTIKPHLMLVVPMVLLIEGRWRCLIVMAMTAALLALSTLALWGAGIWLDFLSQLQSFSQVIQHDWVNQSRGMVSFFNSFRHLGVPADRALWMHGLICLPLAWFGLRQWRRLSLSPSGHATILLLSVMLPPYLMTYDLQMLWPVLVMLALRLWALSAQVRRPLIWTMLWIMLMLPPLSRGMASHGVIFAPWLFAVAMVWIGRSEADAAQRIGRG